MHGTFDAFRSRYDRITISTIHAAFALSILLHALALFGWLPKIPMLPFEDPRKGRPSGSLAVHLAPPPTPPRPAIPPSPPVPVLQAPPTAAHRPAAPKMAHLPPAAPPVLTRSGASQAAAPASAAAQKPAPEQDLSALIESRRRNREPQLEPLPAAPPNLPPQPQESEQERHNREVAASLGLNRTPSFGSERQRGGGMFQVQRVGYDSAEFFFYGWNKNIRRNSQQMIEVSLGNNPNIRIAIVRRMIAIIRDHVNGDFTWESLRLNRDVVLSARPADNAGLEDFLMKEFFSDVRAR